jgi:hypothetical protein
MISSLDRRRTGHPRFPIRVPIVLDAIDGRAGRGHGEVQDLSSGGALVRLEQALPPGASVRVTLRLSQRAPLALVGTVAWIQPHPDFPGWALGIRFDAELPGEIIADIADAEYPPWTSPPRATDHPAAA